MMGRPSALLRQVASTYLARFATILSTLSLVPIVASTAGLEEYGLYALVSTMGILFAQDLGMASATTRFAAEAHARRDRARLAAVAAASSIYFIAVAATLSAVLAATFCVVLPSIEIPNGVDAVSLGGIAVANTFVGLAFASNRQLLSGVGGLTVVNFVLVGQAIFRVVATVAVVSIEPNVTYVAAVDLLSSVTAGISLWILRRRISPSTASRMRNFRWSVLGELARFSSALLVMTLAAVVILQSGPFLAGLLLPLGAVAVYTAANRAFLLVRETASSLSTALLPSSTANFATGLDSRNALLYLNGTRLANAAMLALFVPVIVFAEGLLSAWVGPELAVGYVSAQILILSMLANNNHIIAVPILTGMGRIRVFASLHAVWAVSGLALAPFLTPHMGVNGIALSLCAPVVLLEPLYIRNALKHLRIDAREFLKSAILRPYAAIALPALLMVTASLWVDKESPWQILGLCAAWMAMASAACWAAVLEPRERRIILNRFARTSSGDEPASRRTGRHRRERSYR